MSFGPFSSHFLILAWFPNLFRIDVVELFYGKLILSLNSNRPLMAYMN